MSSMTAQLFGIQNNPVGQITLPSRRHVGAKVNALAGYQMDFLPGRTPVSIVRPTDSTSCDTTN